MDLIAKAVTLKSIKLNDPTAKNLLFSAKHSVLYTFDPQTCSWEKTETEGCLAIYKRAKLLKTLPTVHVLFILNRLRPENFSCPLSEIESVQLEGDLLMLLLKSSKVMGIWLFDEKERQLALNVLQSKLNISDSDNDDEDSFVNDADDHIGNNSGNNTQLKPISVTDLLGGKKSSPTIVDILSKAKVSQPSPSPNHHQTHQQQIEPSYSSSPLETAICDKFNDMPADTSLKSFTNSVCQFIQANPQLLASLHRQLTSKRK